VILAGSALVLARLFSFAQQGAKFGQLLLLVPVIAVVLFVQGYAVSRSARRTRPRSRKEYLLWSLAWLVMALVGLGAAGQADLHHLHWLTLGFIGAATLCFVYALALFGRGAFRGRLRRAFWHYPPWWAFDGVTHDRTAAGTPLAAMTSSEQSPARSPLPSEGIDHSAGAAFIREQPVHQASTGGYQHRKAVRSGRYEIICIACGDNPDLDYSDVPAEIQHVRGPYPSFDAARDALRQHLTLLSNH
jgi:hypothetical protein